MVINWDDILLIEYDPRRDRTRVRWKDGRVEVHDGALYVGSKPFPCTIWKD